MRELGSEASRHSIKSFARLDTEGQGCVTGRQERVTDLAVNIM